MFIGKPWPGRAILGVDCNEAMLTRVFPQFIGKSNTRWVCNAIGIEEDLHKKPRAPLCYHARSRPGSKGRGRDGQGGSATGWSGWDKSDREGSVDSLGDGKLGVWGRGRSFGDAIDGWGRERVLRDKRGLKESE